LVDDDITGAILTNVETPNGGKLTFNFATGAWTYSPPSNAGTESFQYTLVDGDGDVSTATLSITVEEQGGQVAILSNATGAHNGGAGNDLLVYDSADDDPVDAGEGWDILRIDDGALALAQLGSGLDTNSLGSADNVLVDLTDKALSNIEIILLTEEAGTSTAGMDPNDDVGTTLRITAADIFEYTDADHALWILGSPGDVAELGPASDWIDIDTTTPGVQGTNSAGPGGQTFTQYQSTSGALVYIENEVRAQFNP
jgi:hypothetical protein